MKKSLYLLLMLFLQTKFAQAQKPALVLNEKQKYLYYEVVDAPGKTSHDLLEKSHQFLSAEKLKKADKIQLEDEAKQAIIGHGVFVIPHNLAALFHTLGEVKYNFHLEAKNSKYRFWLTDFVYIPYQRNRYNNYAAVPGLAYPLEKTAIKITQKDLLQLQNFTAAQAKTLAGELHAYLTASHEAEKGKSIVPVNTNSKW